MPFNFGNGTGSNSGGGDTLSTQQKNFLSAWTTDTSAKSLVTEYTVTTGTNSIKLGDDHKISAGGGELTIQIGDDYYFAVLQTLSQNNHLNFIKITSAEAVKEVQSTNSGDIIASGTGTSYTTTDSEVVTGITVIPATSGYLTYTIYSGNSNDGTVIYSKTQLVEDDDIGTEITLTDSFWLANNTAIFAEFSGCSLYGDSSLGVYTTINYFVGDLIYIPTEFTAPLFNDEGVLQIMLDTTYFDTDTDGNLTLDVSNIDATELKNASSLVSGSIQGTFAETATVTDFADAVNGNFWIYQSTAGTSLTLGTYTFSDGDFLWCYADVDVTLTTLNFSNYFSYVKDTSSTATDSIYGKVLLSTNTPAEATEDGDAGTANGIVANADHSHPFATQPVVHGGTGLEIIPALSILGANTADTVEAITVPSSKTTDLVMTYDYDNDVVGWSEYVGNSTESSRTLDYGVFYLASNLTLSGSGTYRPFDTALKTNGDITLGTNGVNLIGGRTYRIKYSPYVTSMDSTNVTLSLYNYTTSTEIDPSTYLVAMDTTASVTADNTISTIYTPDEDCVICLYSSSSTSGTFYAGRSNVITVVEIPSTVTAYVPADEVTVTNNDTATANQVLSSNGDQTATWSDDLTLNGALDVAGDTTSNASLILPRSSTEGVFFRDSTSGDIVSGITESLELVIATDNYIYFGSQANIADHASWDPSTTIVMDVQNGYLGLGSSTLPSSALEVVGSASVSGAVNAASWSTTSHDSINGVGIRLQFDRDSDDTYHSSIYDYGQFVIATDALLQFGYVADGSLSNYVVNDALATLNPANGYLKLGATGAPSYALDVTGDTRVTNSMFITRQEGTDGMVIWGDSSNAVSLIGEYDYNMAIITDDFVDFFVAPNGNPDSMTPTRTARMNVTNGSLRLGDSGSPAYILDVVGVGRTRGDHIFDGVIVGGSTIELGPQDGIGSSSDTTLIDFHANSNTYTDYDGRIIVSGGDASGDAATASMQFEASTFNFGGPVTLNSTSSVDGDILVVVSPPASSTATGVEKQVAYDSDYMYLCVATDTWRRVALASW